MKKLLITLIAAFALATVPAAAQTELKKVYNEEIDPLEQIDKAVSVASEQGKYVVCQVGGNWCPWCLRFAHFATTDNDISQLIEENFEYIHVNYNPSKARGADQTQKTAALMKRLDNPSRFGFPVFVVLNTEGEVIHIQDSSFLEEGEGYDKEKVIRFFKNWTPAAVGKQTPK